MSQFLEQDSHTIIPELPQGGSLTDEQCKFYADEGYLVVPGLLSEDDLTPAKEAMKQKVQWIAETLHDEGVIDDMKEGSPFETRLADLFADLTEDDFLRFSRSWRDRIPGYYHLMASPRILDVIESLIGGEIFANPVYNVRPKVPGVAAGAVPWHQDKSYWPDANSNPVITAWVPIVRADQVNGCLQIWPRTHRTKVLDWNYEQVTGTQYLQVDEKYTKKAKFEAVTLPVDAGDVIFFNDRCIHMSTPNNSKVIRWSCDLRYQPTDQDPMPQHGAGFLARSYAHPERVASLEDWMEHRPQRGAEPIINEQLYPPTRMPKTDP